MSDTPKDETNNSEGEIAAAITAAKGEIAALVEAVRSQKAAFDSVADTSATGISAELDKAKSTNQEIASLRNEAVSAKGEMETERNDLVSKSKAAQTEIENTRNSIATTKGAIEATQKSATTDAAIIAHEKAEIEKLKATAAELSEKLTSEHSAVEVQISELQETKAALADVLKQISGLKGKSESDSAAVTACLEEIGKAKDRFENMSDATGAQYDALVERQDNLKSKISEIEDAHGKIGDLKRSLLDTSGEAVSVEDQIAQLQTDIGTILSEVTEHRNASIAALNALTKKANDDSKLFSTAQDNRFADLYTSLQQRILDLLPSAGAAGLASTYYDAKSRYAPTSFAGRLGDTKTEGFWGWVRARLGYNPASLVATIFFYALFILPLGFIVVESVFLLYRMENDVKFVLHYDMIIVRFLIVLPLLTLSGFGFASLQLYRRLFEEYNHKQRVMELYESFSEEISASGSDAQKKNLLDIMLKSVSEKAWEVSAKTTDKTADKKDDFDLLAKFERLTSDLAKLKEIVGH